jgi:hypothetical protein
MVEKEKHDRLSLPRQYRRERLAAFRFLLRYSRIDKPFF